MKSLSCKDMGVEACDFVATAETNEEVMAKAGEHAKASHPEVVADEAAAKTMMESKIVSA
jgi:predicted small metal-binding protein